MNKKKIIAIGVVFIVVLGCIGYVGYKYVFPNEDLVMEEHDTSHLDQGEVTVTSSGLEIASLSELVGSFNSVLDSSELFFVNGLESGTSGKYKAFTVKLESDGSPENLKILVDIDATSLFTFNDMRDGHLKGDEFFNVEKFSTISFASTSVQLADSGYVASGAMNFMGMEQEVIIPFKYIGKSTYPDGVTYHVLEGDLIVSPGKHGMDVGSTVAEQVKVSFYLEMVESK